MNDKANLSYDEMDEAVRFREQHRFVFSIAIVATYFVVPDSSILWRCLGYTVGFSAFFSALYLIMSAAQLKYRDPGRMYEVFVVSESLRTRAFDWSVHVFAVAVLFFFGILFAGATFNIFGSPSHEWISWLVVGMYMLLMGISLILLETISHRQKDKKSKPVPRI